MDGGPGIRAVSYGRRPNLDRRCNGQLPMESHVPVGRTVALRTFHRGHDLGGARKGATIESRVPVPVEVALPGLGPGHEHLLADPVHARRHGSFRWTARSRPSRAAGSAIAMSRRARSARLAPL